jgi:L-threonylcarbamoyladenylate synthase
MGLINQKDAIQKLLEGTPVAVPTETVYGLAAPISNTNALKKIFSIKKRPLTDPLIVHVSSLDMALDLVLDPDDDFIVLAKHFWPGPLTLVAKKDPKKVSSLITSSLDSVAIRFPDSKIFLNLIDKVGPLAAPSANLFKQVSPTKAEHVLNELPKTFVLEGKTSSVGIESTIYDVEHKTVLRPGAITAADISKVLNKKINYSEQKNTPGSEKDHYQPQQTLWVFESLDLLNAQKHTAHSVMPIDNDPKVASEHLYQNLRDFDLQEKPIFTVFKKEWLKDEPWRAFKNRLKKASTHWSS